MHKERFNNLSNAMVYDNKKNYQIVRNDLRLILNAWSNIELYILEYARTPTYKYNFVYLNKVASFFDQTKYIFVSIIYLLMIVVVIIILNARDLIS